jgi:protein O-GlcNAc transferase
MADTTGSRADEGLPAEGFVFACFNAAYKITPDVFDVWMRLLRQLPGSVLWLLAGDEDSRGALIAEAQTRGVAAERLVWARPLPLAEHLARLAHADLFIDTFHYNAHTTCSDALWTGLPVLTLAGPTFASRVAASLLRNIGLPELVTHDVAAYEALAMELANSPGRLAALRQRLRENRGRSALFDSARFARGLEAACEAMWQRHLEGLAPDHIEVAEPKAA